ncbi:TlpA family protein disulfide reductase [Myxococcota bacterium]|nr:TlpA family protein disulfide reductase [Myxococcota bacterium]MBU1431409.1 TlpA family protein disulfide reductase [Myxococcota bacterium]MBU1898528.1 TlpA family protein disulfide reductase [Myxococcota bacterium]
MSSQTQNALSYALLLGAVVLTLALAQGGLTAHRGDPGRALAEGLNAELIDAPAPPIRWRDPGGQAHSLDELRGQVVFVNFFATWCAPCRQEIPDLEALAASMKGLPFTLLAVSQDNDQATLDAFFKDRPSAMKIVLQEDEAAARYGTEKLPESYIIDPHGRLRMRFVNVQPWADPRVARYLQWLAGEG